MVVSLTGSFWGVVGSFVGGVMLPRLALPRVGVFSRCTNNCAGTEMVSVKVAMLDV